MSFYLITDLETVRDAAIDPGPPAPDGTVRLDAAPHHRIAVFGTLLLAGPKQDHRPLRHELCLDERKGLRGFIQTVSDTRVKVVTFAGRSFDFCVILAACLRHGLPFARYFTRDGGDMRYRYSGPHIDLMDQLSEFGAGVRARLSTCVQLFGFPGKRGVDGSKVGEMVAAGKLAEVAAYNLEDLVQTAALLLRFRLLTGELTADAYTRAAEHLVAFMRDEPLLQGLLAETDTERFTRVEAWTPQVHPAGAELNGQESLGTGA